MSVNGVFNVMGMSLVTVSVGSRTESDSSDGPSPEGLHAVAIIAAVVGIIRDRN